MRKDILKIILAALTAIFVMVGIGTVFLAGQRKRESRELRKQEALQRLENIPVRTPSPTDAAVSGPSVSPTVTPSAAPVPTMSPTPALTPAPSRGPAFNPEDYTGIWYSEDGLASVNIYELSGKYVSFYFTQNGQNSDAACEADVVAEVAGNASGFSFTDTFGNSASGNLIFDHGRLYVKISTVSQAAGVTVSPDVDCIMQRSRPQTEPAATATAAPEEFSEPVTETPQSSAAGDYFFPDSDSRYLTDEELSLYSAEDLELAKNEIYARHGRKFVTERIAGYFTGKSWYQGTIDAETFDAMNPDTVFNEYEIANIEKIAEWEKKKRN